MGVVTKECCLRRKHTFADDKADLQDLKERFLKGRYFVDHVICGCDHVISMDDLWT